MKKNLVFVFTCTMISSFLVTLGTISDEYRLQPAYLTELINTLYNGENVIFTKFGDGEYACMSGQTGKNCDGDMYHNELSLLLRKALISLSRKPNAYIGKWHYPQVYEYYNRMAQRYGVEIPYVSYHLIMNDDLFLEHPYMHQLVEFLVNTKRKKIVMANADNRPLKDLFRADVYIELPPRSWSFEYQKWKNLLEKHLEKDAILLIAGGLCSKVLINEVTDQYDITCLDLGSSFDIMGGKIKSRYPREHSYEDEVRYYQDLLPATNEKILIDHVKKSIQNAKDGISKLDKRVLSIDGMSSPKVRHLLNNICSLAYGSYLEIGVWKGSTLISALFGNSNKLSRAIAIENWSQFGGPKQDFLKNIATLLPAESVDFYDLDCFTNTTNMGFRLPVNIYFYDGDHIEESQYKAFTHFNDVFANLFIAIVDDWNHMPVQRGTRRAFQDLGYQVLFEEILPARYNGDTENWWNGLYVGVIKK